MKLTKEQIRTELHARLNVMVDRMFADDFVLDTEVNHAACFEFVSLELTAHKEYLNINGYNATVEQTILTLDAECGVYAEFDTRSKEEYRYHMDTITGVTKRTNVKWYYGDGAVEQIQGAPIHVMTHTTEGGK